MEPDDRDAEQVRELRVEGPGLYVVGGAIIVALVGAFFLGRWYERKQHPAPQSMFDQSDPLAHVTAPEEQVDVGESADFFDTVEGQDKQAEPEREVRRRPAGDTSSPAPATRVEPAAGQAGGGGKFYVQVFAGRDLQAAEGLIAKLKSEGRPGRLFREAEGQGALYKVRVGGYATREDARQAAQQLVGEGYSGAWVTAID
jgi:cell division protein FtsN